MIIKIYHRPHIYTAARHLQYQLIQLGYIAQLVDEINERDKNLYILYCAFCLEQLPPNYIVYQTEVPGSHWFTRSYMQILAGALAVWDYSISNTIAYKHLGKAVAVVTPGIAQIQKAHKAGRDIDVLFYGTINARRRKILASLKTNITIAENKYGEEMYHLLSRSKVVLNLHHYGDAPLEVFRINEALAYGCTMVSEPGIIAEENMRYREYVYFGKSSRDLKLCIQNALHNKPAIELKSLDNAGEIKTAISTIKSFH